MTFPPLTEDDLQRLNKTELRALVRMYKFLMLSHPTIDDTILGNAEAKAISDARRRRD